MSTFVETARSNDRPVELSASKTAAFAFFTLLAVLILIEVSARMFHQRSSPEVFRAFVNPEWMMEDIYRSDPDLFWKFHPSRTLEVRSHQYGVFTIRINNQGFRGKDWPRNRPTNHFLRILVIGDSCVFGWGSGQEKSFPQQMEALLNQVPELLKPVDVMNASVPGYSSHQALKLLNTWGDSYRPHYVIPFFGSNDVLPCILADDLSLSNLPGEPAWKPFLRHFHAWDFLERGLADSSREEVALEEAEYLWENHPEEIPRRVALEDFERNLEEIHRVTQDLGARNLFMTRQHAVSHPRLEDYNEVIRKFARETDSPLVDVAEGFLHYASTEVYYDVSYDSIHPNSEGYRLIAERTAQVLLDDLRKQPGMERAFETPSRVTQKSEEVTSVSMQGL